MKVWATSDLHIDYLENKTWVYQLSSTQYVDDYLIIAGDISDDLQEIQALFENIRPKFNKVFFLPGNHDLWIHQADALDSFQKCSKVEALAQSFDITTRAYTSPTIRIIPLYSWYDFSFGYPSKLITRAWKDFRKCQWKDQELDSVTAFFHLSNQPLPNPSNTPTISFSHFLPFVSMFPRYIPDFVRALFPVFGSKKLEEQIKFIQPDLHLYGHSHLNRSFLKEGICYLNNAYGYPKEKNICRKKLLCIYEAGQVCKDIPQWPTDRD
jgi:Icc-related predicted phosphoesterase